MKALFSKYYRQISDDLSLLRCLSTTSKLLFTYTVFLLSYKLDLSFLTLVAEFLM